MEKKLTIRHSKVEKTDFQSVSAYLDERLFDLKDRAMRALKHAREAAAAPTQARKHRAFAAIMDMEAGQKMLALAIHEIFDRIVEEEGREQTEGKSPSVPLKHKGEDITGESIQPAAIKYYCENRKITLKALAEKAKVPYSSMKKYAQGLRPTPDKVWERIQGVISKKERR